MRQKITLSKVIQSHPRGRGFLIWQLCSRGKVLFPLPSFFPSSLPGQMYKSRGARGRGLPSCMFIVCSSCLLLLSPPLLSLSSPYKCLGEKGAPRKETRKKGRVVGKKKTLFTSPSSFFGRRRRGEERGKRWHFPPFFSPSFLIVPLKGGGGVGRRRRRRRSVVPPFPPMEGRWRFRPPRMETRGGIRQRLGLFRVGQLRRTHILGDICCTNNAIVKVWRMSPTTFGGGTKVGGLSRSIRHGLRCMRKACCSPRLLPLLYCACVHTLERPRKLAPERRRIRKGSTEIAPPPSYNAGPGRNAFQPQRTT